MGDAGYPPIPPDSGLSGGGGTDCAKLNILIKTNKKLQVLFDNKFIICMYLCVS